MSEKTITPAEYARGYKDDLGQQHEYIVIRKTEDGKLVVLDPAAPEKK